MRGAGKQSGFSYWKRSWHKWFVLAAAGIQLLSLWMNLREYRAISAAGVFSASELTGYAVSKMWLCMINGLLAGSFLGVFLIGMFAQSQRMARLSDGVLLLLLFFVWGAAGVALRPFPSVREGFFWALILLTAFGGAVYSFWQCQKLGTAAQDE